MTYRPPVLTKAQIQLIAQTLESLAKQAKAAPANERSLAQQMAAELKQTGTMTVGANDD